MTIVSFRFIARSADSDSKPGSADGFQAHATAETPPVVADPIPEVGGAIRTKTLPPSVVKDIEQKNIARRLAGLSPIVIKVRRCIACGSPFESAGNRTCGCSSRTAGTIAGREII